MAETKIEDEEALARQRRGIESTFEDDPFFKKRAPVTPIRWTEIVPGRDTATPEEKKVILDEVLWSKSS